MIFVSATIAVFIDNCIRGWETLLLHLDEETSAEVRINISLTRQLPNVISVIKPELGFHLHI